MLLIWCILMVFPSRIGFLMALYSQLANVYVDKVASENEAHYSVEPSFAYVLEQTCIGMGR